jgi:hypothetical protein
MMVLDSINKEQSLYVMKCGDGFSCYGFDVLDRKARAVAAWCKVIPPLADKGTPGHFEQCAAIMDAGARYAEKTRQRCNAELTPQLVGLEGKRVEVEDAHGERRRFWVGKSTGWMPCHLEIKNARSSGGPAVMGAPFKSIQVIKGAK